MLFNIQEGCSDQSFNKQLAPVWLVVVVDDTVVVVVKVMLVLEVDVMVVVVVEDMLVLVVDVAVVVLLVPVS